MARNHELSGDRLLAEDELRRKIGTLRYLRQLRLARERAQARAAAAAAAAGEAGGGGGGGGSKDAGSGGVAAPAPGHDEPCPVCHDAIGSSSAVLPCGHQLCVACTDALTARLPAGTPWPLQRVACPTCRARHHVGDVAYVADEDAAPAPANTTSLCATDAAAAAALAGGAVAAAPQPGALPAPPGGWWAGEAGERVTGSYGSKVGAGTRYWAVPATRCCLPGCCA